MPKVPPKRIKLLYAIQGTGNGHIARSLALIPELKKYASVSVLISGIQADLKVPFTVNYRFNGLSFIFGKYGGIDFLRMLKEVSFLNFLREAKTLDLSSYDVVINDFEPVSSLACKRQKVPCIQLSHQTAVIQKNAPKPRLKGWFGKWILHHYVSHNYSFGFHFNRYSPNTFTPIIRKEIRNLVTTHNSNHFSVYLPAFSEEYLARIFHQLPMYEWEIFSKKAQDKSKDRNVRISPVNGKTFLKSMAAARGIICGAGFETPAECMVLGKKLLVVPMHHQYEQHCNAAALADLGVKVLKDFKADRIAEIQEWIIGGKVIKMNYPDNANYVAKNILKFVCNEILPEKFQAV